MTAEVMQMPVAVAEEKQQLRRMIDRMEPEDVLRMLDCSGLISLSGVDSFSMTAETAFHSCP